MHERINRARREPLVQGDDARVHSPVDTEVEAVAHPTLNEGVDPCIREIDPETVEKWVGAIADPLRKEGVDAGVDEVVAEGVDALVNAREDAGVAHVLSVVGGVGTGVGFVRSACRLIARRTRRRNLRDDHHPDDTRARRVGVCPSVEYVLKTVAVRAARRSPDHHNGAVRERLHAPTPDPTSITANARDGTRRHYGIGMMAFVAVTVAACGPVDAVAEVFRRTDYRGVDLRRRDLSGRNFSNADLRGANLTEANLARANLRGAHLNEANLHAANLTWADLTGADLTDADLSEADLRDATMTGATIDGTFLSGAVGARLEGTLRTR